MIILINQLLLQHQLKDHIQQLQMKMKFHKVKHQVNMRKKKSIVFFKNLYRFILKSNSFCFRVLKNKLFIQPKKHFGGAFVNITHSTVHVPTIIYSLSKFYQIIQIQIFNLFYFLFRSRNSLKC